MVINKTVFISDLHLHPDYPELNNLFEKFAQSLINQVNNKNHNQGYTHEHAEISIDKLYILGDFFNYWIGDDVFDIKNIQIKNWLDRLVKIINQLSQYIEVYFLSGNRDFLINSRTSKIFNFKLLPQDEYCVKIYNQSVILLHGDTLCTEDISYQRYRKVVHNKFIQYLYLKLPLRTRHKLAGSLKKQSRKKQTQDLDIYNVSETAVEQLFNKYNTDIIIHGHTHKPKVHEYYLDNRNKQRYVLGDWHPNSAYYLEAINTNNQTKFNLVHFTGRSISDTKSSRQEASEQV